MTRPCRRIPYDKYRGLSQPDDHDPVAYAYGKPPSGDDLLQEAGLDTWARGVVRREMSDARGVR